MKYNKRNIKVLWMGIVSVLFIHVTYATNYTVSDKASLLSRMATVLPGDTVIVANGTYDWGQINFTNNNGTSVSNWIVLKAQSFNGVIFSGSTYLQFKATKLCVNGFKFANGNAGTNAVISFRASSSNLSNYCRITNITIDNYNTYSADSSVENEWVGIYGTNNRVDHCTFINKYNARATIVVWYSTTTYPAPAITTSHQIDSNYFNGRSYMGANGGETIRVGDSNSSRTKGNNIIEFNLFENCTQVEPEIISNKSQYNTYRYNTFKNNHGGLTLRHGRYCSVYSNFFIVDNAAVTEAYGIRAIDKGHKIFNNYLEGLNGNQTGGTSQLRAPINLYNGVSSDTTDPTYADQYFPCDSCVVAFNTIVNAKGGGGIVLGGTGGGTIQPKGIQLGNNVIKMSSGTAVYMNPANTLLTYSAEGNMYNAPSGLGLASSTGFTNTILTFGARVNGILTPSNVVQDAAVNTSNYSSLLANADAQGQIRSAVYDVGADEINGTGSVLYYPLNNTLVGAGTPLVILPVHLISFDATLSNTKVNVAWSVTNQVNFKQYEVEWSTDGSNFRSIAVINANNVNGLNAMYSYLHINPSEGKNYYRLKMINVDGSFEYSLVKVVNISKGISINVFPNPAQKFISVNLNGIPTANIQINLIDAEGRTVKRFNNIANSTNISIENLSAGIYELKVANKNKILITYPLMIINK